jgi:hypothetical protein
MTPEQGLRKQIEVYRRMTGRQRLEIGFELYELAHEMIRCSVRHQHPDWTADQVGQEVLRRFRLAERIP